MGNVAGVEDALLSDDAVPELEPRSPGGRGGGARAQPQQQHGGGGAAAAAAGTSLECVNLRSPSAQRAAAQPPPPQQQHHTRWQTDRNYLPGELERRRRALDELLSSERNYVACLETLVDTFVAPLNAWADEIEARRGAAEEEDGGGSSGAQRKGGGGGGEGEAPEVTRAELLSVFSNTEQIAAFNRQLLLDLDRARRDGGNKAMLDQLLKAAPFFKMYGTFVRNFEVSRETLNALEARPAFAVFLKACELQRACRGLQLRDLLIMPVQRIPRYRLLLETMVRHTKDADPLSRGLAENLAQMSAVVDQINQDVHKMERRNRVLALQYQFAEEWVAAARTLVKDGPLTKVCRGGPRRFQFVLFSDLLVYGSETLMGKWGKRQYKMNRALELARCYVVDGLAPGAVVPAGAEESAFMVLSADKCFVVQASDAVEKAEWVAALRGAMDALATKVIHAAGGPSGDSSGGFGHGSLLKVPLMAKAKKKKAAAAAAAAMAVAVEDTSALRSCSLWVMSTEGRVTRAAFLLPRAPSLRVTYRSVLGSPRQRALFRQHLEATRCEENLDFCEAVAKYAAAAASGAGQQGRVAAARALMDRFIADGAPQQVNLSESMREEVVAAHASGRCGPELFSTAVAEASRMLESDSFARFRSAPLFAELLALAAPRTGPPGVLAFADLEEAAPQSPLGASPLSSPPLSPQSISPASVSPAQSAPPAPPLVWEMGPHGPVVPAGAGPPPWLVRLTLTPGPEGLGMNLELGDAGECVVAGYRQLGRGLLNPAQEGGVLPGDVLLECGGAACGGAFDAAVERLRAAAEGTPLAVVVRRTCAPPSLEAANWAALG